MVGTKRGNLRLFRAIAVLSPCLLPLILVSPAAAEESEHVRVQFSGGSDWSEIGPNNGPHAPLPSGPAHANYGHMQNAQAAAPQDRLRLKPMNFDGM
jgi:hypothetical protein